MENKKLVPKRIFQKRIVLKAANYRASSRGALRVSTLIVSACCVIAFCLLTAGSGCGVGLARESARKTAQDGKWDDLKLWYAQPAGKWNEALAVGNGRLGAMVFGDPQNERIQFNDDTLWTGGPHEYQHEGASDHLATVRNLIFEGKQRDAERLAMEKMMSVPLRQEQYQPFGDLRLNFPGHDNVSDYRRELDIDSAVATVRYRVGETTFTREIFSSFPDQVIVVRVTSDKPGKLTFTATMDSPHADAKTLKAGKNTLALRGRLRGFTSRKVDGKVENALKFEAHLRGSAEGGSLTVDSEKVTVTGADAVTLVLAAATSFKNYKDVSGDPQALCSQAINKLGRRRYDALRQAHTADHRELFRRVALELGTTPAAGQPTDERIKNFTKQDDPQFVELYFQYGRYLLIASSRPGSQPANLQGIWNDSLNPPWESKWTTNINTEMNYWPAEVANLSECHEPLFAMIEDVAESGAKTAKVHYNCRGWILHHNTDLWRGTAPINNSNHGIWVYGSSAAPGCARTYGRGTPSRATRPFSRTARIRC